MRPFIVHLLEGLQLAGIDHTVISLGDNSTQIMDAVAAANLSIMIEYVFVPPTVWRTLANSINSARRVMASDASPFLIIRADQVYDWRLIRKLASVRFTRDIDAYALVDTEASTINWARGAHCTATCKESGKCNALVKVHRDVGKRRILRLAHQLDVFDAVNAGDMYVSRPAIFDVMKLELSRGNLYCSTAQAMSHLARRGTLAYVEVGEFRRHWFGSKTVTAVFQAEDAARESRTRVRPVSPVSGWQHVVKAARDLMFNQSDLIGMDGCGPCVPIDGDDPSLVDGHRKIVDTVQPLRTPWPRGKMLLPLLKMGSLLGEGSNCQVVAATVGQSDVSPATGWTSTAPGAIPWKNGLPTDDLAVKIYETGHSADRAASVMREVMWEVHVLRQIRQPQFHVATLLDAIEFPDAVYIVMERYSGPDLQEHIRSQPNGSLTERVARPLFCHILAGIRHAHSRGFLHCDLKPANVRLSASCNSAVVVDWGMARALDDSAGESIAKGTPFYASPEQLTGHNPEQAWGIPKLGPSADVWALGATLYEMVQGQPPFGGGSFEELIANVMHLQYAAADESFKLVSPELERLVRSMLQIAPSERSTIDELCKRSWIMRGGYLPPAMSPPPTMGRDEYNDSLLDPALNLLSRLTPELLQSAIRRHGDSLLKVGYGVVMAALLWHSCSIMGDEQGSGTFKLADP